MKKFLLLSCVVLICTISVFAQDIKAIEVIGVWEGNKYGQDAVNNDYCPYYITLDLREVLGFSNAPKPTYSTTVHGKMTTRLYTLALDGLNSPNTSVTYRYYRGDMNGKINVDFKYALPIKQGTSSNIHLQDNSDYTIVFDLSESVDTVYACRGGIVCDDVLHDTSSKGYQKVTNIVTIFHNDGTMAEYKLFSRPLVYAGDVVKVGDPIAVCDPSSIGVVSVGVYFLDKNKVKVKDDGRKHSHFKPFYHVSDSGAIRLEPGNSYTAEITEEMILQDMSKSEQKKYQKNK